MDIIKHLLRKLFYFSAVLTVFLVINFLFFDFQGLVFCKGKKLTVKTPIPTAVVDKESLYKKAELYNKSTSDETLKLLQSDFKLIPEESRNQMIKEIENSFHQKSGSDIEVNMIRDGVRYNLTLASDNQNDSFNVFISYYDALLKEKSITKSCIAPNRNLIGNTKQFFKELGLPTNIFTNSNIEYQQADFWL